MKKRNTLFVVFIVFMLAIGAAVPPFTTIFMRTVLDDPDASTARTTLGLGSGDSPTFSGLTVVNAITEFSTDGTLVDDSDSAVPTEKAVKTYIDTIGLSTQPFVLSEMTSDPATWPSEGKTYIWMSDGTGQGDDGDLMVAAKAGGVIRIGTLWDYSGGSLWVENLYYAGEAVEFAAEQVAYAP